MELTAGPAGDGTWRAHLHSNLTVKQGDVRHWAWSCQVPQAAWGAAAWWSMCSWFGSPWEGVAPMQWQISADRRSILAYNGPGGPVASFPIEIGKWHDWVVWTHFHTDPSQGWFELWHRLRGGQWQKIGTRYTRQTLPSANAARGMLLLSSYCQDIPGVYKVKHDQHALYGSLQDAMGNWGGE
jgi:hypothetical protein